MDVGKIIRRFAAVPLVDPFRRAPEVVPEPVRSRYREGEITVTIDGEPVGRWESVGDAEGPRS